jgi:hypothetical protein
MAKTPSSDRRAAAPSKAAGTKRGSAERPRAAAPAAARHRATPAEQLATETLALKEALDGAVAQFGARVSGQLAEVVMALQRPEPPSKGTVREMLLKVQDVRLKPERGRIKDLVRLKALADDLVELLARD